MKKRTPEGLRSAVLANLDICVHDLDSVLCLIANVCIKHAVHLNDDVRPQASKIVNLVGEIRRDIHGGSHEMDSNTVGMCYEVFELFIALPPLCDFTVGEKMKVHSILYSILEHQKTAMATRHRLHQNLVGTVEKENTATADVLPVETTKEESVPKKVVQPGAKIKKCLGGKYSEKSNAFLNALRSLISMIISIRSDNNDSLGDTARDIHAVMEALHDEGLFTEEPGYAAIKDLYGKLPFTTQIYTNVTTGQEYDKKINEAKTYYKDDIARVSSILKR